MPAVKRESGLSFFHKGSSIGCGRIHMCEVQTQVGDAGRASHHAVAIPKSDRPDVNMSGADACNRETNNCMPKQLRPPRATAGVYPMQAQVHRRVMEEDESGACGGLGKPVVKPFGARRAEAASASPRLNRINQDEPQFAKVQNRLYKAIVVPGIGKHAQQLAPVAMITRGNSHLTRPFFERPAEMLIRLSVTIVSEVAAQDQYFGNGVQRQ